MNRPLFATLACLAFLLPGCGDDDTSTGGGGASGGGGTENNGGAGGSGGGTQPQWEERFDPLVEALLEDLEESGAYGVSVAIMEGGEVTFAHAFGSKDAAGTEPLLPTTLMQIGSTTKQMTSVGLLQKVEAGDVALDDTLEEALPMLELTRPEWTSGIQLHHLLSHQSGLLDLTQWYGAPEDDRLATFSYGGFATQVYQMNPAGAFWNYSNPNFVLAGLITEENDTRAYPDILGEDVFLPLGMDRTFLRKSEVEADGDFASSYGIKVTSPTASSDPEEIDLEEISDFGWLRPAGLAWTTPTQMMAWADFIMRGNQDVLSDELRAEVTTRHVSTLYSEGTQGYGYGMFVSDGHMSEDGTWYPMRVWDHGGNTLSFTNILYILPDQDFAIAICSSAYGTDFGHSLDTAVRTLVDLPEPGTAPEYEVDPTEFDRHVGTYEDVYNVGQVIITREGDDLFISMPDLDAANIPYEPDLFAISSDIFILDIQGQSIDLTFVPDTEGGDSTYIRNRIFVATREEQTPAFAPRTRPENPGRGLRDVRMSY